MWGAPQEIDVEETREGRQQQKASVPLSFRGLSLRFFDADAKLIAEMPGEGEPSLRLDLPDNVNGIAALYAGAAIVRIA